jgi:glycerol-3-phosphate dehydrogenase
MNNRSPYEDTDVIIIGGGATGAGIARDCARRG